MTTNIKEFIQTFFFGASLPFTYLFLIQVFGTHGIWGYKELGVQVHTLYGLYLLFFFFIFILYFVLKLKKRNFFKNFFHFWLGFALSTIHMFNLFISMS